MGVEDFSRRVTLIVQFLKKSIPTPWNSSEIRRGRGVSEAKILVFLKFSRGRERGGGGGVKNEKTFHGGSMDIFWNALCGLTFNCQ